MTDHAQATPPPSARAEGQKPTAREPREGGLCVFHGEALGRYAFPDPHPFGAHRLPAFWAELMRRGLDRRVAVEEPAACAPEELAYFHSRAYIEAVQAASARGAGLLDAGDTPAFPGVFEAASTVVGTTLRAVRFVVEGRYRRAFNPIGGLHHARTGRAGGFCVFNDVGVAIELLRRRYGIRRVGYVDIDAHHGDGVYYGFEADPELFVADVHEDGRFLYPGTGFETDTGAGAAAGTKLNIGLAPGAGDSELARAFERVEAHIDRAYPEILLFQCGADGIAGDPLTHLRYVPAGHRRAAERLRLLADRHCGGKLVALGGGGYDPRSLATAWCEVVEALV